MKCVFLFITLITSLGLASEADLFHQPDCEGPWFTGPLLAPGGHVVPKGMINVEPYLFYTVNTGLYDREWKVIDIPNFTSVDFQILIYIGITDWMDILFAPQSEWNAFEGTSSLQIGDLPIQLEFQVLDFSSKPILPSLKVYIGESFPIGPFQKGKPENFTTDLSGSGSFETTLGFVLSGLFEPWYCHFLDWRLNGFVTFFTNVPIKGITVYGGVPTTKGTISPGLEWGGIVAFQYTLTKHWALALDIEGIYENKTSFKGFPGTTLPLILGIPSNFSFSIAPAIEYNFNESLGMILGTWFTLAGRNTPEFYSIVFAVNYFGPISKLKSPYRYRSLGGSGGSGAGSGGR